MDSEISELASEIRQIERLLQAYGSSFWAREMDICTQAITADPNV